MDTTIDANAEQRIRREHERRLLALRAQAAVFGVDCPVHITNEIRSLESRLGLAPDEPLMTTTTNAASGLYLPESARLAVVESQQDDHSRRLSEHDKDIHTLLTTVESLAMSVRYQARTPFVLSLVALALCVLEGIGIALLLIRAF